MDLLKNTLRVWAMQREFRAVLADLNSCSDRELKELGLARGDLARVAWEEAERRILGPAPSRPEPPAPARWNPALVPGRYRQTAAPEIAPIPSEELRWPTREERRRILREAYRLRAEARARVFGWPLRALARLARRAAAAIAATELGKRAALACLYRQEFEAARSGLDSYTDRELARDLLFPRSEIDAIAAEEAKRRVAQFVREHPEYRQAARHGRGRRAGLALQNG
jgi:hypothetical protein